MCLEDEVARCGFDASATVSLLTFASRLRSEFELPAGFLAQALAALAG